MSWIAQLLATEFNLAGLSFNLETIITLGVAAIIIKYVYDYWKKKK